MFAFIDTKGATHIAINIPHEGADKSIPALAGMLERNAVFVKKSWSTLETCEPEMSVQLGDSLRLESSELDMVLRIPNCADVLCESFVQETPEVLVSNRKGLEKKDAELQRLRVELASLKQQLDDLRALINDTADS